MDDEVYVKKRLLPHLLGIILLTPNTASAVGLGSINTQSNINEKLRAVIPVLSLRGNTTDLSVSLASGNEFAKRGIRQNSDINSLTFSTFQQNGRTYVRVNSIKPINSPYLNFVVQLNANGDVALREYAVFLDAANTSANTSSQKLEILPRQSTPTIALESTSGNGQSAAEKQVEISTKPVTYSGNGSQTSVKQDNVSVLITTAKTVTAEEAESIALQQVEEAPQPTSPVAQPVNAPAVVLVSTEQDTVVPQQNLQRTEKTSKFSGEKGQYGPIRSGETLWSIARYVRPSSSVSIERMVAALKQANPSLGRNGLQTGTTLVVPTLKGYGTFAGGYAPMPGSAEVGKIATAFVEVEKTPEQPKPDTLEAQLRSSIQQPKTTQNRSEQQKLIEQQLAAAEREKAIKAKKEAEEILKQEQENKAKIEKQLAEAEKRGKTVKEATAILAEEAEKNTKKVADTSKAEQELIEQATANIEKASEKENKALAESSEKQQEEKNTALEKTAETDDKKATDSSKEEQAIVEKTEDDAISKGEDKPDVAQSEEKETQEKAAQEKSSVMVKTIPMRKGQDITASEIAQPVSGKNTTQTAATGDTPKDDEVAAKSKSQASENDTKAVSTENSEQVAMENSSLLDEFKAKYATVFEKVKVWINDNLPLAGGLLAILLGLLGLLFLRKKPKDDEITSANGEKEIDLISGITPNTATTEKTEKSTEEEPEDFIVTSVKKVSEETTSSEVKKTTPPVVDKEPVKTNGIEETLAAMTSVQQTQLTEKETDIVDDVVGEDIDYGDASDFITEQSEVSENEINPPKKEQVTKPKLTATVKTAPKTNVTITTAKSTSAVANAAQQRNESVEAFDLDSVLLGLDDTISAAKGEAPSTTYLDDLAKQVQRTKASTSTINPQTDVQTATQKVEALKTSRTAAVSTSQSSEPMISSSRVSLGKKRINGTSDNRVDMKLELVKSLISIGNEEKARKLLKEIMAEGQEKHLSEAKTLLLKMEKNNEE